MNKKRTTSMLLVLALMLVSFTSVFADDFDIKVIDEEKTLVEQVWSFDPVITFELTNHPENYQVEFGGKDYEMSKVTKAMVENPELTFQEVINELKPVEDENEETLKVVKVSAITDTEVTVPFGTTAEDAIAELDATVEGTVEGEEEPVEITINWTAPEAYDAEVAEDYVFVGTLVAPEGYVFGENVETEVTATVTVEEEVEEPVDPEEPEDFIESVKAIDADKIKVTFENGDVVEIDLHVEHRLKHGDKTVTFEYNDELYKDYDLDEPFVDEVVQAAEDDVEDKEEEIKDINEEIKDAKGDQAAAQAKLNKLTDENASADKIAAAQKELDDAKEVVKDLEDKKGDLEKEKNALKAELLVVKYEQSMNPDVNVQDLKNEVIGLVGTKASKDLRDRIDAVETAIEDRQEAEKVANAKEAVEKAEKHMKEDKEVNFDAYKEAETEVSHVKGGNDRKELERKLKAIHDETAAIVDAQNEVEEARNSGNPKDSEDAREEVMKLKDSAAKTAMLEKLDNLDKVIEDKAAAKKVDELINKFEQDGDIDEDYVEMVEAAREAYDLLTKDQQDLVESTSKLETAEDRIAADKVTQLIISIPYGKDGKDINSTNLEEVKSDIAKARTAYEELTEEQQELVNENNLIARENRVKVVEKAINKEAADKKVATDALAKVKDEYTATTINAARTLILEDIYSSEDITLSLRNATDNQYVATLTYNNQSAEKIITINLKK